MGKAITLVSQFDVNLVHAVEDRISKVMIYMYTVMYFHVLYRTVINKWLFILRVQTFPLIIPADFAG